VVANSKESSSSQQKGGNPVTDVAREAFVTHNLYDPFRNRVLPLDGNPTIDKTQN